MDKKIQKQKVCKDGNPERYFCKKCNESICKICAIPKGSLIDLHYVCPYCGSIIG